MNKIYRVFVQKKDGFDVEAKRLHSELKTELGIDNLTGVAIAARYDVTGIDEDTFNTACKTVFSEPNADDISHELKLPKHYIIRELQPGTYDQRADSAEQCIRIINPSANPTVRCASVFMFHGNLSDDDMNKLKNRLINPVEAREGAKEIPEVLVEQAEIPADVVILDGFIDMTDEQLAEFIKVNGLAMTINDIKMVREYFANEKRNPTITEIKVIDTYWSDHCRHTTFTTRLDNVSFENDKSGVLKDTWDEYIRERTELYTKQGKNKPLTLMDLGTIAAKLLKAEGKMGDLDESEEINACSIRVDADINGEKVPYLVMFKNETHNHPTEIEPFGGAATCLGGAIRDPLSGRSYVYQAMRVTGAADPTVPFSETLKGKLPQRVITTSAANGYSSYGNQIGLATGMVSEVYHPGYAAKRMEVGAVIAAAPAENVIRERPDAGDLVLLVGGRTGRDGCGGATGSSKAHDVSSLASCGAEVQKGNPITERKLQRLFRNPEAAKMIRRCNDFGAGGVSVAVGELADGINIDLDKVPKKYDGLDGTELAISESQERMAVVIAKENEARFKELAAAENLECTRIAEVTEEPRMVMHWRGKTIVDISRAFLDTNGAESHTDAIPAVDINKPEHREVDDVKGELLKVMASLNHCSQRGLSERFDSTVGANTLLMPLGGKYQRTPQIAMAAKLPVENTTTGTVMTYGFNPYISEKSPFHGAVYAVMESLARITCVGGDIEKTRLSFQEYFEKLGKDPNKWGKPLSALLGAYLAQRKLKTAAIGGKDSMSGSFPGIDVPPTLISFAVSPVDSKTVTSCELKKSGNEIILLPISYDERNLPDFDGFIAMCNVVKSGIESGKIVSARTVSSAGIAQTLTEMAFGNMLGFDIKTDAPFDAMPCSVIIEVCGDIDLSGIKSIKLGAVTDEPYAVINDEIISLEECYTAYTGTLESVFPVNTGVDGEVEAISYDKRSDKKPTVKIAKPRVIVPVFPGTNCEYESLAAFNRAGGIADSIIIRNTASGDIEECIEAFARAIKNSQIIMIPGGFSAGDEPDGSAKFTSAVFRSSMIKDAVHDLLYNRDGLILGICNGFQTLIKLGLVPYGEIRDTDENAPTLTFNRINRHQSRIVSTRISSVLSPWLSGVKVGDVYAVPISHGEGRFVCNDRNIMKSLIANGQVATQYVDVSGNPTMDIDYNPAQSQLAIEGITSPDGRIFGKMGHSERYSVGLYKNVVGEFDAKIFESGVRYFAD